MTSPTYFERYVAIGDSSTAGLKDPDGRGGYRGWSRRLAARIAELQGGLLYANLGVSGLTTREISDQQVEQAVRLEPDLVTIFTGTNDVLHLTFDARFIEKDMERMQKAFFDGGTKRILTFTLPDLTPIMPIARGIAPRIRDLNEVIRSVASRTGTTLLDFAAFPVAIHPELWHEDRIHANAAGHARIAEALAHALGLPGTDDGWKSGLPPVVEASLGEKLTAELKWGGRYLVPWIVRAMRNGIAGKTPSPRRPTLVSLGDRS